jgi:hypothetical protein
LLESIDGYRGNTVDGWDWFQEKGRKTGALKLQTAKFKFRIYGCGAAFFLKAMLRSHLKFEI